MEPGNIPPRKTGNEPVKILVMDDEQETLDLLTFELERHGYAVTTVRDGQEGLEKIRNEKFSLVISDITMPRLNGIEALSLIKNIDPGLEVIMTAGSGSIDTAVDCMKRGAYDFVSKPYNSGELLSRIEKALEKRHLSTENISLKELHRLKAGFLANIGHELRTPLNAILGYTSLMIDQAGGGLTEKQRTAVRRIAVNASNLLQILNNILDISQLSSDEINLFLEDFRLAEVLEEVTGMMEPLAGEKNIYLRCQPCPEVMLFGDRTRLKQILINVIGNAVKFTHSGGVTVTASLIPAKDAEGHSLIRIDVTDTGIGIRPEALETIFGEFKQADPSIAREYGGTGLGLSISRRLAHRMGGTLTVESAPGKGSTFTLSLPHRRTGKDAGNAPSLLPPPPVAGAEKTILLAIDDDPDTHQLLRDGLEGTAYTLASALSGDEGIALVRQLRPFAVILDVLLPRKDGWAVLQSLKSDPDLWAIPVIMLSVTDNRDLAYTLGASDYIMKPFSCKNLVARLARLEKIRNTRVLVVDDDKELNMVIQMLLANIGYRVISACSAEEALVSIEQDKPDVVILDLNLPDGCGPGILETISGKSGLSAVRIIATTDTDLSSGETEKVRARAETIIGKSSCSIRELLSLIKSALETDPPTP